MNNHRARELRKNATHPEREMWRLLRPLRDAGYHFRRQVPMGTYYADFVCHKAKLVVEVDGETHGTLAQIEYDKKRDSFLRSEGYDVLRVANDEVLQNKEGVYWKVEQALLASPHPSPPHEGEGVD
ncbi:endonuclease domain-containing protein [Maritalea sp.]|uniref:endonuclease domain-containing protein n=1 Tax=Maritalea sp. TaxID=2003361 RepID=UPI003EF7FBAC